MTHRYAPRTHSGCCRVLLDGKRCSECGQLTTWKSRLTTDEAERVTARMERPVVVVAPEKLAQMRRALYEEAYD